MHTAHYFYVLVAALERSRLAYAGSAPTAQTILEVVVGPGAEQSRCYIDPEAEDPWARFDCACCCPGKAPADEQQRIS
jgi:hypothetical protein